MILGSDLEVSDGLHAEVAELGPKGHARQDGVVALRVSVRVDVRHEALHT